MNRKTVIAIVSALFMVAGLVVAARSGIRMYRVHNATPVSELEVSELKEGQWLTAQVDEVLDWYSVKKTGSSGEPLYRWYLVYCVPKGMTDGVYLSVRVPEDLFWQYDNYIMATLNDKINVAGKLTALEGEPAKMLADYKKDLVAHFSEAGYKVSADCILDGCCVELVTDTGEWILVGIGGALIVIGLLILLVGFTKKPAAQKEVSDETQKAVSGETAEEIPEEARSEASAEAQADVRD